MNVLPSLKDLISIEKPLEIKISPDSVKIAYTVEIPNWKENRYENLCFIYFIKEKKSYKLTKYNTESSNLRWFSDNSLALLVKDYSKEKSKKQIMLYENLIGEGMIITDAKEDVTSFECFANGFVYVTEDQRIKDKQIHEQYGEFVHIEDEESKNALFYVNLDSTKAVQKKDRFTIEEDGKKGNIIDLPVLPLSGLFPQRLTIERLFVSEKSKRIFLNCRIKDDLIFKKETLIYIIEGDITKSSEKLLAEKTRHKESGEHSSDGLNSSQDIDFLELKRIYLPIGSHIVEINETGQEILIDYHEKGENFSYTQKDIWKLSLADVSLDNEKEIKKNLVNLTKGIDQDIWKAKWIKNEIFLSYYENCSGKICKINIDTLEIEKITIENPIEVFDFDIIDNSTICIIGSIMDSLINVFLLFKNKNSWSTSKITSIDAISKESLGSTEKINWESRDGTIIEGILRKPMNFDAHKKYPLVLIVHGGPTWISRNVSLDYSDMNYYPTLHFINNGILVLKPNYRGSIGRGADFMKLNKDNLGIGDLWDIESGIEYLINQGFVDKDKVGCMGWSQGGYISAFATVNSTMFKAISVGAGISDWYTYYISTDIRHFTLDYLSGNPYENPDNYKKTSPMTNIKKAKTPTLIQHGSSDARVPYSNATELFRSLNDLGVHTEFFSFTNMPHGIHKPKENRALVTQNFAWFSHFLLGKELNFYGDF